MRANIARTAEHVGCGHPDKFCDQLADAILDQSLSRCGPDIEKRRGIRVAMECLAKDNLVTVSGETKWPMEIQASMMCGSPEKEEQDVHGIVRKVWEDVGYGAMEQVAIVNNIRSQSPDIAEGGGSGVDAGGAGDQGIMVGYATDETKEMMPLEWVLARDMAIKANDLRKDKVLPWLRSDVKTQVTVDVRGKITNIILAAQHEKMDIDEVRVGLFEHILRPMLEERGLDEKPVFNKQGRFRVGGVEGAINGTGNFEIGGTIGDAGVVGRKIVVDAYGPRVPVGGGAYSGKDPSKVDRSAAYMARHIAKYVVANKVGNAKECLVHIAYGIGQLQPEMVTAITDLGEDVWSKISSKFQDLQQTGITEYLGLRNPEGWSYQQTAAYGHYGRDLFPWEKVENVPN